MPPKRPRGQKEPREYVKPTGVSPDWSNLPRKRCLNCGARFKPARPDQLFCRTKVAGNPDHCRKEYHRHGGAYAKLKGLVEKLIEQKFAELRRHLDRSVGVAFRLSEHNAGGPLVLSREEADQRRERKAKAARELADTVQRVFTELTD